MKTLSLSLVISMPCGWETAPTRYVSLASFSHGVDFSLYPLCQGGPSSCQSHSWCDQPSGICRSHLSIVQVKSILIDPYANAFNIDRFGNTEDHRSDSSTRTGIMVFPPSRSLHSLGRSCQCLHRWDLWEKIWNRLPRRSSPVELRVLQCHRRRHSFRWPLAEGCQTHHQDWYDSVLFPLFL